MSPRIVADGPLAREEAAAVVAAGGIVAIPTDTVYGLATGRANGAAIERLQVLKGRPQEKGIALLLADPLQAPEVALMTPSAIALGRALWPGGLTLVVPSLPGAGTADALLGPEGTIGIRVPDHPCPRRIAALCGPLPASSANRSGESEAADVMALVALFGDGVDLYVDGGPATGGPASTVVDCTGDAPRIMRLGAIGEDRIAAVLRIAGVGR
jgi:tRNA threonylcarbamoyl adenosine modification protein (Sua5/YciO/YrdC/YwlC family)